MFSRAYAFLLAAAIFSGPILAQQQQSGYVATPSATTSILGQSQVAMTNATCNVVTPGANCTVSGLSTSYLAAFVQDYYLTGTLSSPQTLIIPLQPGGYHCIGNSTGQTITAGGITGATVSVLNGQTQCIISHDGVNYVISGPSSGGGAAITALTGDGTAAGPGSVALTLATVNGSPGACGDATHVCAITTNGKGLVTAQAATAIATGTVTTSGSPVSADCTYFTAATVITGTTNCILDSSGNMNTMGQLGVGLSRANTSHVVDSSGSSSSTTLNGANPVEMRIANTDTTANNYEGVVGAMTNSTPAVVTAGKMTWVNTSHTAAAESADLHFLNRNAGTVTDQWQMLHTGGMTSTGVTGGDKGAGTINMAGCYVAGVACATGSTLPTATVPGQIITATAAGTTYAAQGNIFYQQSGDTIASIEAECSSPCTYVVTSPQTITLAASHTMAANVFLRFEADGLWTINGAFTMTFQGNVLGTLSQHFAGNSTIDGLSGAVPAEWFGVVGQSTITACASGSDYTTQFQKALNSLSLRGGWVQLQLLAYNVTSGLSITHSSVGIRGVQTRDGYPSATPTPVSNLCVTSATAKVISVTGTSTAAKSWWNDFENFSIQSTVQQTGTTPSQSTGFFLQYLGGTIIKNVVVNDFKDGFYLHSVGGNETGTFEGDACYNGLTIVDSYTSAMNLHCVEVDSDDGAPSASTYFNRVGMGVYNTARSQAISLAFYIHGTAINDQTIAYPLANATSYGIDFEYTGSGTRVDACADLMVRFPIFDAVSVSAIKVNGLSPLCNAGLNIIGGYLDTSGVNNINIVDIESSSGVNLIDNIIYNLSNGSGQVGVLVNNSSGIKIIGNECNYIPSGTCVKFTTSTNSIVSGNNLFSYASFQFTAGFSFTSTSTRNTITGNNVVNYATTAYSFDGTSTLNQFTGNACGTTGITTCVSGDPIGFTKESSFGVGVNDPNTWLGLSGVSGNNVQIFNSGATGSRLILGTTATSNPELWMFNTAATLNSRAWRTAISTAGVWSMQTLHDDATGSVTAISATPATGAVQIPVSLALAGGTAMTGNQGNGLNVAHCTGPFTTGHLWVADASGNCIDGGAVPTGTGTVTSIATTGPITGGTITSTGTIACATCGVTGSPLSQFASTTSAQLLGVISDETGTGSLVFATGPVLSGTPQAPTAALGTSTTQIATTGFVTVALQGSPATPGAGSGVTSVDCFDASGAAASCTSARGSLKIVGGTATTGAIATVAWSAESTTRVCSVTMNGNGSTGTAGFDIGHTAPTTTGFSITAGLTVLGATIYLDYYCSI